MSYVWQNRTTVASLAEHSSTSLPVPPDGAGGTLHTAHPFVAEDDRAPRLCLLWQRGVKAPRIAVDRESMQRLQDKLTDAVNAAYSGKPSDVPKEVAREMRQLVSDIMRLADGVA